MSILSRLRQRKSNQKWDVITWPWGGWNFAEPIMADEEWGPHHRAPADPYLKDLIYMAEYGWYYYQKALVEMQSIHPLTSYKPIIDKAFRQKFDEGYDSNSMPLLLYEKDGKLIMARDWEAYWLYRERETPAIPCLILGHFNEAHPSIAVCDRPFKMERPDLVAGNRQPVTNW